MIAERHFKNEDKIKDKIVNGYKRGVCDSNGRSIKVTNSAGQRVVTKKPRFNLSSSVVKRYVYRRNAE